MYYQHKGTNCVSKHLSSLNIYHLKVFIGQLWTRKQLHSDLRPSLDINTASRKLNAKFGHKYSFTQNFIYNLTILDWPARHCNYHDAVGHFFATVSQQNVIYEKTGYCYHTREVREHFMMIRGSSFFILGDRSGSILQVPEISSGQKFVKKKSCSQEAFYFVFRFVPEDHKKLRTPNKKENMIRHVKHC